MRTNLIKPVVMLPIVLFTLTCKERPLKSSPLSDLQDTSSMILYVGTYTEKEAHVEGKATGIYIYSLDRVSGKLSYIGNSPATINPSYIDIHPSGKWIYAVNEIGKQNESTGTVSVFKLIRDGRAMEFINSVSSEGNYPCFIRVDQTGKFAMTANYGSGTVALLPINADGSLGHAVSVDQHEGSGLLSRQEAPHAHMIINSSDNRFAYSCDLGTDQIYIYRFDTEQGQLIPSGNHYSTQPGSGPRHLTFHPFKNFAYVINELNGTIECMQVDSLTGDLSRFQIISTLADGNGREAASADIHVTPSGHYLYASNRGGFNNIAMYSIHDQTGELTLIGHQDVKGKTPRNFVIDPSGTYLLVANQNTDNVVTFRIDPATGKLTDMGVESNIPTPVCLKFLK